MPTGSGKSLLYQLPAAIGRGLVVVASPLIALMRDQLRGLETSGLAAAALHSGQSGDEAAGALDGVASGRVRLLYAAPERLTQDGTVEMLRRAGVKLFAVDEAHCVSQWGHEFRPEYRALGDVARRIGAPPVLAVTAAAGPRTRADIAASLFARAPKIFVRSFARPNLALAFREKRGGLGQIAAVLRRHGGESGIVYCNSRRRTDETARDLARLGFDARAYHAGLDAVARGENQDAFFSRKGAAMVATIAFGMGVDKPDVRFVLHADLPNSIEGYYQEIGRAGRDGLPAEALALFDRHDLAARLASPPVRGGDLVAEAEYERRKAMAGLCVAPGCRFRALLAEFGEASEPCGRCDHCRGGPLAWGRRLGALALGWRAAAESRLLRLGDNGPDEEPAAAPADEPAEFLPDTAPAAPLRVGDERLLRKLEEARLRLARERGVAPRRIASEALLRALAEARPRSPADPAILRSGLPSADAAAFLRVIAKSREEEA